MLQAYYQPRYKPSALAQMYKETHCISTTVLRFPPDGSALEAILVKQAVPNTLLL